MKRTPRTHCHYVDLNHNDLVSQVEAYGHFSRTFGPSAPMVSWSDTREAYLQSDGTVGWGSRRSPVAYAGTPSTMQLVLVALCVGPNYVDIKMFECWPWSLMKEILLTPIPRFHLRMCCEMWDKWAGWIWTIASPFRHSLYLIVREMIIWWSFFSLLATALLIWPASDLHLIH